MAVTFSTCPTVTPYLVVPDADAELQLLPSLIAGTIRKREKRNGY